MCRTKVFLAMIFNEIKRHVNTSIGLVGGCIPCIPPVSAPGHDISVYKQLITFVYLNDYRQAKCLSIWCYANSL